MLVEFLGLLQFIGMAGFTILIFMQVEFLSLLQFVGKAGFAIIQNTYVG